jgi:kexin
LNNGRDGLGTVYVWAAGNGRENHDRSNYDGYASFYGVMSVCSVDRVGAYSFFSEPGSNLWVCAPGEEIPTTDYQALKCSKGAPVPGDYADTNYTKSFIGTSASAPVVAGVAGLVLREAAVRGKNLGWRDVKMILAETAMKPNNGVSWQATRIGFNDDYGFGIVDAKAAVAKVATWTPVGNSAWTEESLGSDTQLIGSTVAIPTNDTPVSPTSIVVDNSITGPVSPNFTTAITYLEYVSVWVELVHDNPGELEIELHKTNGAATVISKLTTQHQCMDAVTDPEHPASVNCASTTVGSQTSNSYEFGVSNFLGESAEGTWTIKVTDKVTGTAAGSVVGWRLKFYGH